MYIQKTTQLSKQNLLLVQRLVKMTGLPYYSIIIIIIHEGWTTPGTVKSGNCGQLPRLAGSPPIRMNVPLEGVGPSRTKIINQPGGQTLAFGGAVIVHVVPLQENAGKKVRAPKLFP